MRLKLQNYWKLGRQQVLYRGNEDALIHVVLVIYSPGDHPLTSSGHPPHPSFSRCSSTSPDPLGEVGWVIENTD
jgi:hypothetical protein